MTSHNSLKQRRRILIIDDQPEIVEGLAHLLSDDGYEIVVCTNGHEALRSIRESRPDAVILEVMAPGLDGFALLRRLRNEPGGRNVPVVLVSAAWRASDRQRHVGATLTIAPTLALPKPFEPRDVSSCLRQLGVHP